MVSNTTVEIRMYNVGFGDAFRVTVRNDSDVWRMLIDCGRHTQSADRRPIADTVRTMIADLAQDCSGTPHLDVLVATHRHQDHISGFACDEWQGVSVDTVWLPFVEDLDDPGATALRNRQARAARKLEALITARLTLAVAGSAAARQLLQAQAFAANSGGDAAATDRLLGRNGRGFANAHSVRFFPKPGTAEDVVDIGRCGIVAHVLGPSRDPEMLKQMDPPSRAGWLRLNLDDDAVPSVHDSRPLFAPQYTIRAEDVPDDLRATQKALALSANDDGMDLLAAASLLERSVNNTSLFFVLDVGGLRLLFPGDAQYGAWQYARSDKAARALIDSADFYKVGHHGSSNATPKDFVLTDWHTRGDAMVPWGLVELWKAAIPKRELIDALGERHHAVILPTPATGNKVPPRGTLVQNDHWTQLTLTV